MEFGINCTMSLSNEDVEEIYNKSEKVMLRRSLPVNVVEYVGKKASEDFGNINRSSVAKELTKLILLAKECEEKKSKK